jgi:hemolysin activation/secretion protein
MKRTPPSAWVPVGAVSLLALALASRASVAAPPTPDAGQTLQQLQSPPPPTAPNAPAPSLNNETAHPDTQGGDNTTRVHVSHLEFTGNTVFDSATLSRVAKLSDADVSLAGLRAAARRVSQFYHDHGYIVARAYIPAQNANAGVITVAILEGKLGSTTVNNQSKVSTRRIKSILTAQMETEAPLS